MESVMQKYIRIMKYIFQKFSEVIKDRKITFEMVDCNVISIFLYSSESRALSSQVKELLEKTETWFDKQILRMLWTVHATNYEVLTAIGSIKKKSNFREHTEERMFWRIWYTKGTSKVRETEERNVSPIWQVCSYCSSIQLHKVTEVT